MKNILGSKRPFNKNFHDFPYLILLSLVFEKFSNRLENRRIFFKRISTFFCEVFFNEMIQLFRENFKWIFFVMFLKALSSLKRRLKREFIKKNSCSFSLSIFYGKLFLLLKVFNFKSCFIWELFFVTTFPR
jgi:hypothetical protein